MMTKEQFAQRQTIARKEGFRELMQEPMMRALLSTIPPCENLEVLLEAAFNKGFGSGASETAISFIDAILPKPNGSTNR